MMGAMALVIAAAQTASVAGDVAANVARHVECGARAAALGAQLVVFPELSLTGYELALAAECAVAPEAAVLTPLRELAASGGVTLVAGAPVRAPSGELWIAALIFRRDGSVGLYSKQHVHSSELPVFAVGPGGPAIRIAEAAVALAICRDATFPEHADAAAARGATIYAASAMITAEAIEPKSALLRQYAGRHRMAALLANYSGWTGGEESAGQSALWGPDGHVVAAATGNAPELVIGWCERGIWRGQTVLLG